MRRFLPHSLGGQLTVLLLAALLASHAIGAVFFLGERDRAVRLVQREQILTRAIVAHRLLSGMPTDRWADVAAALTSPLLRFEVAAQSSLVGHVMSAREEAIAAALANLAGVSALGARARMSESDRPPPRRHWRPRHDDDDDDDRHGPPPLRRPRLFDLALSVPLAGGGWMNVETGLRAPPPTWTWPSAVSLGLSVLAILLVVAVSARRITRPLGALADGAERLGRGEPVAPLKETGPDEVRRTTAAFNAMRERLTRFVADRTRMLAAISHDLRTPLTALRLRAEMVDDEETRSRMIAILEEMQRMTEAALAFARDAVDEEESRATDLAALVYSVADDIGDMGHDIAVAAPDRLVYRCRPLALKRAVRNLIENAVRYGLRARVTVEKTARGPLIAIEDDGPGIPEDRLEAVFEPFVRLEESRSAETGGVGLGLSIARGVVHAHGGELTLENRRPTGLCATIHLPAIKTVAGGSD